VCQLPFALFLPGKIPKKRSFFYSLSLSLSLSDINPAYSLMGMGFERYHATLNQVDNR
jgi:hypothetical protein